MNLLFRIMLFFLLPLPLLAQQPTPTSPAPTTVQLNVTVTGHSGKPVSGLIQSNFTVLDNGSPQPILRFHAVQAPSSDPPVRIILLIDTVNASLPTVAYERDQIVQLLRKSGPTFPYPLSFIFFSDTGTEIQQAPSNNTTTLLANLEQQVTKLRTIRRSSGFYGAAERQQLSLKTLGQITDLEQKIPGRKLLIWISPGWPYLSGPRIELSARDERGLFSSVVGLSTALQHANITLYSVDPVGVAGTDEFRTTYYESFLKGVTSPRDVQSGNLALQVLAQHTGGKVLNSGNDIAGEIAACIEDASAFYVLTVPRAPSDSADKFHAIEVKLSETKLKARTLNGYYAQP
jgi:VWFA-related protein